MSDKENNSTILPASAREYIGAMVKKMRYRRKVREDVRAEIAAHFEDELRDCKTDEEKEKKAEQLVEEFGDLKLLAILLRRAKKRCRPLWRTLVARTCHGIGILLLCFIFYAIWFSFGQPTIRVDYIALLNQLNQPEVRDENNAWPYYKRAIDLYVPPSPLVEQFISYRHNGKDHEEAIRLKKSLRENGQRVERWLIKNQKHWDHLTADQKRIFLKCLEYDWVPFPKTTYKSYTEWYATTFHRMTEHILRCIQEESKLTLPHPRGVLPESVHPEFPSAELKMWLQRHTVPPNNLEAVSVAVLHEAVKRFQNLPDDVKAPLTDIERDVIGSWIVQNERAWRQFLTGSEKAYCYRPYFYESQARLRTAWKVDLEHLQSLRKLTTLGIWRSRLNRSEGRLQQSLEDGLALARAGSHWTEKALVTEQLNAQYLARSGYRDILRIVNMRSLPAADLGRLRRQLAQIYPEGYPLMNVEGERLALLDIIQRSFTEGGPGGGHLIPSQLIEISNDAPYERLDATERRLLMPLFTARSMTHAGRDATIAKVHEIYDQASKLAEMTPYQKHVSHARTVDEIMHQSLSPSRFFLFYLFRPASARFSEILYWGRVAHEATLTILALEQWRLEKNTYPTSLCELVSAGFLTELPLDPWSDKPLAYRKTDDDFILYSVGTNFTDDGGEPGRDKDGHTHPWIDHGDMIFWPLSIDE